MGKFNHSTAQEASSIESSTTEEFWLVAATALPEPLPLLIL